MRTTWWMLAGLLFTSGCASAPRTLPPSGPGRTPELTTTQGVVLCADGAGGYGWTTEVFQHVLREERVPLRVEMIHWSHGRGKMMADHLDWGNIRDQARRLTVAVQSPQATSSKQKIYLVGHSAGCAVLLEAASQLPADSIERIVLLAPSVSTDYDLRRALTASRLGIDVFISQRDWVTLGLGMRVFGTTDRRWSATSGRVGFRRVDDSQATKELYSRVHQHFWESSDADTGHSGGHYGSYEPEFVRRRVVPLLTADPLR